MSTTEITRENFGDLLKEHDIVLVDAWAAWCGPCRAFGPIYEAASARHPDAVWGKLDTESQPELAGAFGIRSIPTLLVFRQGVLLFQQAGLMPGPMLDELLSKVRAVDMDDVRRQLAEHEQKRVARAAG